MRHHGKNRRSDWLSPEAYDALSLDEKRALWLERKSKRGSNRLRGAGRKNGHRKTPWIGFGRVVLMLAGIAAWELSPRGWFSSHVAAASGALEVRARFGLCRTGGGTNCVVDGDTIWLEGENIRIADIDAPETHDYQCPQELALGARATERLHELVNSGAVSLASVDRDQDRYGRKLRLVFVDGKSVGDTLVSEGLARYYRGGKRPWC